MIYVIVGGMLLTFLDILLINRFKVEKKINKEILIKHNKEPEPFRFSSSNNSIDLLMISSIFIQQVTERPARTLLKKVKLPK